MYCFYSHFYVLFVRDDKTLEETGILQEYNLSPCVRCKFFSMKTEKTPRDRKVPRREGGRSRCVQFW